MKQQTAVDWLLENISQRFANALKNECQDTILEAKQREKEQINKAYYDGYYEEKLYDARSYYSDTYIEDQPPTQN